MTKWQVQTIFLGLIITSRQQRILLARRLREGAALVDW